MNNYAIKKINYSIFLSTILIIMNKRVIYKEVICKIRRKANFYVYIRGAVYLKFLLYNKRKENNMIIYL